MPNTLTGEFDAVLELSGATVDRLLSSMHQNSLLDSAKPSVPHVAYFRLGDREDAERGSVAAQIGVPRILLLHGATDRFLLEVGVRARYRADPGSKPLADIIHGVVRAEYRFQDIDPECLGWRRIAGDYLWMRVVRDSVSFEGTAFDESSVLGTTELATLATLNPLHEMLVKARIAKLVSVLLETRFAPRPQPVSKTFRHMRFLSEGGGRSAVAVPFGLNGEPPNGRLASVDTLFLGPHDFGLAISSD